MKKKTKNNSSIPSTQVASRTLPRDQYILLLHAALSTDRHRFARDTALNWLGNYPGDLQIGLLYAKALVGEGHQKLAKPILEGLCQSDPEFLEAVEALQNVVKNESNGNIGRSQRVYQTGEVKSNEINNTQNPNEPSNVVPTWNYALRGPRVLNKNNPKAFGYNEIASWGQPLWQARRGIKKGDLEGTEKMILLVIGADPPTPIAHLTHLEYLDAIGNTPLPARLSIAEHYHRKWPNCLPITLLLAKWMMASGDQEWAVDLLHQVASRDISGQVIKRLWGANHSYTSLWSSHLELKLTEQIPADVAYVLGWNKLPGRDASQTAAQSPAADSPDVLPTFLNEELETSELLKSGNDAKDLPGELRGTAVKAAAEVEVLKSIKEELEQLAKSINKPGLTDLDGRFPIYVVFSVRNGLENKYGKRATNLIINEMIKLVDQIQFNSSDQKQQAWGARLFMPDDPLTLKPFGIDKVEQNDPWKLKLAIRDLDDVLARRGEMIGALLIVGGPEVVPFHHLPNPVDDPDDFVASDNPYGTKDENYFIPEWPIGRLPGGRGTDPNILINSLRRIQKYHTADHQGIPWYWRLLYKLIPWIRPNNYNRSKSLGYSAEVWRKASQSVFQPIGENRHLFTSPPLGINGKVPKVEDLPPLSTARLGYFNLHGLVDAAEWYGQSDPTDALDGTEYPIALRPQDINLNGQLPQDPTASVTVNDLTTSNVPSVVFTEACYGANVTGKTIEEALSLMFLAAGSMSVVGSTSMSYGSLSTPLIAADLLGHAFWRNLRSGIVAGEALRQAKIHLAQEMHDRQGYLDGEDQKTLISFVNYGDPLAQFKPANSVRKGIVRLTKGNDDLNTVCDRATEDAISVEISPTEMDSVKQIVAQYLPGMTDAQLSCTSERAICHADGHVCPTSQLQDKSGAVDLATRKVITLSKQIEKAQHLHNQFARITFDESGKLVKLVVSR
jgi:hypothetical protein